MANGASSNDMMAGTLAQLVKQFNQTDRGWCLNHVLHLVALQIINPLDVKPGQLDRALVEAMRKLAVASNELKSVGDPDDDDNEEGKEPAGQEDEEE